MEKVPVPHFKDIACKFIHSGEKKVLLARNRTRPRELTNELFTRQPDIGPAGPCMGPGRGKNKKR